MKTTFWTFPVVCLLSLLGAIAHARDGGSPVTQTWTSQGLQGSITLASTEVSQSRVQFEIQAQGPLGSIEWTIQRTASVYAQGGMFLSTERTSYSYPIMLSQGGGTYRLTFYRIVPGQEQGSLSTRDTLAEFKVENLDRTRDAAHSSTQYVQSDAPEIQAQAQEILSSLSADAQPLEKIRAVYAWVTKNIAYDIETLEQSGAKIYDAVLVLQTKKAICNGYANLTAGLLRAMQIPAKVVNGIANPEGLTQEQITLPVGIEGLNHAWNEVLVDGRWITLDSTWDAGGVSGEAPRRFIPNPRTVYFDPPAEEFAKTHRKIDEPYML